MKTTWGYDIADDIDLVEMISIDDFNSITANKYAGDVRIYQNISAACMAIRNYCGWHVYPQCDCAFSERLLSGNGKVKRINNDILVQLPATYVTDISSVKVDGADWTDFDYETNGLLRLFDVGGCLSRKTKVEVEYTAGLPGEMMAGIRELVSHRVTHALASSAGVSSESAGGVSITYNANWINSARATALPDDNKEVLEPYRVRGVF